jgi:hypothetical protein
MSNRIRLALNKLHLEVRMFFFKKKLNFLFMLERKFGEKLEGKKMSKVRLF